MSMPPWCKVKMMRLQRKVIETLPLSEHSDLRQRTTRSGVVGGHMEIFGRKELYLTSNGRRCSEGPIIPAVLELGLLEGSTFTCNVMQPPASAGTTQE